MAARAQESAKRGATELLDATPGDITKLKRTKALEDLPTYLKEKGFTGNVKKLSDKVADSMEEAGKTIGEVAETYDNYFLRIADKFKKEGK